MRLSEAASIADLADMARRRLPRFVFDFLDGGAGSERGLSRNRERFDAVLLRPHYGRGVVPELGVPLFGRRWRWPIGIAPVGMANLLWPGAELALARIAQANGVPFVLSTAGTTPIEQIAEAAPDVAWFQLYMSRRETITRDLLRRADQAGIQVLVVTVDVAAPGNRLRDQRNGFVLPFRPGLRIAADLMARPHWSVATLRAGSPSFAVLAPYAGGRNSGGSLAAFMRDQIKEDFSWQDLKALRDMWPGTLVVKGLLAADDALMAHEAGADAIWVSNHGGRQLESAPATIDALPLIRETLGPTVPVLMDSGVRCGEDIAKARLLGADFVFSARCFYYGVAAAGQPGGEHALKLLTNDLTRALTQLGCPSFEALNHQWLWAGQRAERPGSIPSAVT